MQRFASCAGALIVLTFLTTATHAGLMAYYSFDSDFTDGSGNANDLIAAIGTPTITSTAGEYVFGGGALDADSTVGTQEYLTLTSPITFNSTDPWSVAFWVRRRPGTDFRTGMVVGDPANSRDFIWTPDNPSQVQGLRFRSSVNQNANFGTFADDGQFHHWAVVADGAGNVTAYRDNVAQPAQSIDTSFSIAAVAQAYNQSTQSLDGQIDELYIYDEAIDADTVATLFNGASCSPGDTDGDGDIDTGDITTSVINFTGAGGSGKTCADGDTDGDGDVDTGDLTFSVINFTGAMAGNAGVPDLVYDPATGNVTIDADGADVISFSLQSGPFNAADFSELPAGLTDNIATQIGWTSFNLFSGLTGTANLGAILPAGLDLAGLEAALATASYGLALSGGGGGGRLDLIIPEPGSIALIALGAVMLTRRRGVVRV